MQDEADTMAFEEHAFMKDELEKHPEEPYKFELHQQQYNHTKEKIHEGTEILAETDHLERQKDDLIKEREKRVRELDTLQRKVSELVEWCESGTGTGKRTIKSIEHICRVL